MSKLFGEQFDYGTVEITTDASGNGTATVTFGTAFDKVPEVKVIKPLNDIKGNYGVKNSPELILAKGRQPMGSISAFADGGTGYTLCTDDNTAVSAGAITEFADNGDGKTLVTNTAHLLNEGTVIQIYDALAATGMNGFFVVEQIQAAAAPGTFVIDREFIATGTANWQVLAHDLADDDLIEIRNSSHYSGEQTVSSSLPASGTFEIAETYTAEASPKAYWKLLPTCTVSSMTVEVVGSSVRGGTVSANWTAFERQ